MTTIAANAGPEKTTKWLLIGGLALALITGVIVFMAMANVGSSKSSTSATSGATGEVLVAKDNIGAGTRLTADMFRVATFSENDLVPGAISDPAAIVGQTATTDIQRGQQLSSVHLAAATDDKRADQLAFKIPAGHRAVAVKVDAPTAIGGLLVPGDRVDVLVTIKDHDQATNQDVMRVQTVLQAVLVVAREQTEVQRVVALGTPTAESANANSNTPNDQAFQQRPEDIKPDAGLSTVSLALTPADVQRLVLAESMGTITLSLRPYGENDVAPLNDVSLPRSGQ
jgi:Flp pilus assembly protein CpaB